MKVTAYTYEGAAYAPGDAVSLSIDRAMDAPADRFEGSFPLTIRPPELHTIRVEQDGVDVFYGVVDEQTEEYTRNGGLFHLSARSLAALLLDNEAMVQNYENPTLLEIYKRHAKPHGILGIRGTALAHKGTLTVGKGQSDWTALAGYCRKIGGLAPRITPDRYLDVRLKTGSRTIKYSNTDADGVRCLSMAHTVKRCRPVSAVLLKSEEGGTYQFTEQNPVVLGKGIARKRLMEIGTSVGGVQRSAKELMRESNYEYDQYLLRAAGEHLPEPGNPARIQEARLGAVENLAVAEVRYRQSAAGSYSDIILVPERNLIV